MIAEWDAKQAVADAGRKLLHEKLVARTWGNVSCRTGPLSFVITPSGLSYESTTADDVVSYDMTTGKWEGTRKPSSEKGVHAAAYAQFPEAGFVIHTHQTYASALGLAGFQSDLFSKEVRQSLGGVALASYGLPSTKKLSAKVTTALATGAHCVLMVQHGAVIVGKNQEDAFERAKLLEAACKAACKGQPGNPGIESPKLADITQQIAPSFPCVACTSASAVVEVSKTTHAFRAQLDDMAQMVGPKLVTVEMTPHTVLGALNKYPAVLVAGGGAICRAESQEDCDALRILVEKACVSFLHTRVLGIPATLSALDTRLMRFIYLKKYSKKAGK